MELKQFYSKIVPFRHMKFNDAEYAEEKSDRKKNKYWFMNMQYRSSEQIEQMKCVKVIWDQ